MDSHGPLTTTTRSLALHDNRRIVLTNAKIRSNEPVVTCECIYPRIVRHRRAHEKWQNYQNSNGSGKIRNKVARIDGVQAPFNDEILPRGSLMSITLATSRYNEAWWTFPLWLSVFPIDEHAAKLRPRENNRWQEGGIGFLRARSLPALFIALIHLAWLFFSLYQTNGKGMKVRWIRSFLFGARLFQYLPKLLFIRWISRDFAWTSIRSFVHFVLSRE